MLLSRFDSARTHGTSMEAGAGGGPSVSAERQALQQRLKHRQRQMGTPTLTQALPDVVCAHSPSAPAMPGAAGLTPQPAHTQGAHGAGAQTAKKPKSRLHGYVKSLAAPGGIDVQVLFESIRKDISYILRVQMRNHKRLFLRWLPRLNLDPCNIKSFKLEQSEAVLVFNSFERVFRMVTQALHDGALPPSDLCRALNGAIVQCTRVDSGADVGDILWHAMCTECLQGLRGYVDAKGLEKMDIKLKQNSNYLKMLQIKQAGDIDISVYCPAPTPHDIWPFKPGACAACNALSGVIKANELLRNGANKAHAGAARRSRAPALGAPPRSFQNTYHEHLLHLFEPESETAHAASGNDAGCEVTNPGSSEDEGGDMHFECEALVTSEDDSDEEAEQGQGHALTMDADDFDREWDLSDFFMMQDDTEGNVRDFLHNMRTTSPLAQTEDTGDALAASASARAGADTGTYAETREQGAGHAMQGAASALLPGAAVLPAGGRKRPPSDALAASSSAGADTGTYAQAREEGAAVLPAGGRKRSPIDYVLHPGWVPSNARAAAGFALRMLRKSAEARASEAAGM